MERSIQSLTVELANGASTVPQPSLNLFELLVENMHRWKMVYIRPHLGRDENSLISLLRHPLHASCGFTSNFDIPPFLLPAAPNLS